MTTKREAKAAKHQSKEALAELNVHLSGSMVARIDSWIAVRAHEIADAEEKGLPTEALVRDLAEVKAHQSAFHEMNENSHRLVSRFRHYYGKRLGYEVWRAAGVDDLWLPKPIVAVAEVLYKYHMRTPGAIVSHSVSANAYREAHTRLVAELQKMKTPGGARALRDAGHEHLRHLSDDDLVEVVKGIRIPPTPSEVDRSLADNSVRTLRRATTRDTKTSEPTPLRHRIQSSDQARVEGAEDRRTVGRGVLGHRWTPRVPGAPIIDGPGDAVILQVGRETIEMRFVP